MSLQKYFNKISNESIRLHIHPINEHVNNPSKLKWVELNFDTPNNNFNTVLIKSLIAQLVD